jgi:hypothetical protein
LLPVLYYFSEYTNQLRYIFEKFTSFKPFLKKLFLKLQKRYDEIFQEKSLNVPDLEAFKEKLEMNTHHHIFLSDNYLLGFLPLRLHFLRKKGFLILKDENLQYLIKLHHILNLLERMGCATSKTEKIVSPNQKNKYFFHK